MIQGHTGVEWLSFTLIGSPEHLPLHKSPLWSAPGFDIWVVGIAHGGQSKLQLVYDRRMCGSVGT